MKPLFIILYILSLNLFGQTDTLGYSFKIKEQTLLIEQNTTNWEAYYTRGNYKLALNQYKEAIKDYDKAIEIHVKDSAIAKVYNGKGNAVYSLGYYGEALLDYKMATGLSHGNVLYRSNYYKTKNLLNAIRFMDNYYAPWHQKIRDTSNLQTVSKGAFYLFGGFGVGGDAVVKNPNTKSTDPNSGFGSIIGCSVAYKSHLITFDRVGVKTLTGVPIFSGEEHPGDLRYKSNYIGALFGQCVRTKHFLISLSAGVAGTTIYKAHLSTSYDDVVDLNKQLVSIPIEFRFNWLSYNGFGAGFQIAYNIVPSTPYSGLYLHANIVLGVWNKEKR